MLRIVAAGDYKLINHYYMPLVARIVLTVAIVGAVGYALWNHNTREMMRKDAANVEVAPTLTTGNSNDDLDRDMAALDAALNRIEQDSATVDAEYTQQNASN
jgi:hypothetical protein